MTYWKVLPQDIQVLRGLYLRQREIAQDPVMVEQKQLWNDLSVLQYHRPMILAETVGVLDELIPLASLKCNEDWARSLERGLRNLIFRYESVKDDFVVEPFIDYGWFVSMSSFGVETMLVRGENDGRLGSYHWDPPVKNLDYDLDQLHIRNLTVDREKTSAWGDLLEENFSDILPIRLHGSYWWTSGLTWDAINLVGLDRFMLAMYDNPKGLHRLMTFLRDDFLHRLNWYEQEGLLSINNGNDYVGSGGIGYTPMLPAGDYRPAAPVRVKDMWGLSESQETVGVSPQMFEEFIFSYQQPIAEQYGLLYYGCCEPVHNRIQVIKQLKNLRKVSVSPWCDQEKMVDALGNSVVYCRKPNPAMISTHNFAESAIREDLRNTLRIMGNCPLEIVMKDVHTLDNQPWRLGRWVEIAREIYDS